MKTKTIQNVKSIYPLSPMQKGMLFHTIYNQESEEYFEQLIASLIGKINEAAFKKAWQAVVDNNDILRTSFVYKKVSKMLQVVNDKVEVPIDIYDWAEFTEKEIEERFNNLVQKDKKIGFNLSKAPLLRVKLIKISESEYKLLWSHHHILMDGWSLPILLKEVFTYYEVFSKNKEIKLPYKRPYKDFIQYLKSRNRNKAENFWKNYLAGFSSPTPLNIKSIIPLLENKENSYLKEKRVLDTDLSYKIIEYAKRNKITINSFLQAVWAILLAKYSGEDDVVFGATFSGRPTDLTGSETMLGLFINTLPIRATIDTNVSLTNWIIDFHKNQVAVKDFEHTPLFEIQKWSDIPSKDSLFDSLFVFENYPVDSSVKNIDLSFEIKDVKTVEKTNYPITVVSSSNIPITLEIAFDSTLISVESVVNLLNHFKGIIQEIIEKDDIKFHEVNYLSVEEKEKLNELNLKCSDYDKDLCIHQKFEKISEEYPGNIAVSFGDQHITYSNLNRRANLLAYYLRKEGIKPEEVVALYSDKSIDMIIGLLGILKAGGVYLPIDPATPGDRVKYIFEDSNPAFILTEKKYTGKFNNIEIPTVSLNQFEVEEINGKEFKDLSYPENLAYIIYTSGSTGKPKGTLLQHRGVLNLINAVQHDWKVESNSNILQFASINFDASIIEIFSALLTGAMLTLFKKDEMRDIENLLGNFDKLGITFAIVPPSILSVMKYRKIPNLQIIISAGEVCATEIGEKWKQDYNFFNGYGPTEATVGSLWGKYEKITSLRTVPLGCSISNVNVYVLGKNLEKVPIGIPGELYISGENLARGYLGKPDLTAEKFLPDPFNSIPGSRMYKTGDVVKIHNNMEVEFIGRVDKQIKVRGFRIELGEIENVIIEYERINSAAVILKEAPNYEKYIAAFIVVGNIEEFNENGLKEFLISRLPDYMIPKAFSILEIMPLTINGKIDRKLLGTFEIKQTSNNGSDFENNTPTQEIIINISKELTGRKEININDNFFDIGGHSILATQAVSRIREAFKIDFPIKEFFEVESLAELADKIDNMKLMNVGMSNEEIIPVDRSGDLPLSFSQQRLWFLDQFAPEVNSYNIPSVLEFNGELNIEALEYAINQLINRHEILRTSFFNENGKPKLKVEQKLKIQIKITDLIDIASSEASNKVNDIIKVQLQTSYDLTKLPLFQVSILKIKNDRFIVLIVMHHIISDGWSMGILVKEVSELYKSYLKKKEALLPKLSIQYLDYAAWQRKWLSGDKLNKEIEFWKNELQGASLILNLPTDRPRFLLQTFNGSNLNFNFNEELTAEIEALSMKLNITPFMFLLSAFEVLLYKYSGQTDFVIGTPIANRTQKETEALIGFFVNTLAIRVSLKNDLTVKELFKQVRERMLNAYSHQYLPFEKLVEILQPDRDTSHSPIFQVAFVFQNAPFSEINLPNLEIKPYEMEGITANYDITLYMQKGNNRFSATFEYNTDLFNKDTLKQMAGEFEHLLEQIVAEPKQKISKISVLPENELSKIIFGFNHTKKEFEIDKCVHQRFEELVANQPDSIALTFTEVEEKLAFTEQLTYEEVNKRANRLAHYLRKKGVGSETIVGISLPRSFDMIISMLAVLKAGGAFLPIDPGYPEERIEYMLSDSKTSCLITTELLDNKFTTFSGYKIFVDTERITINNEDISNLTNISFPRNLAYIIYTSGSTGKPKGTMLTHIGLFNLALSQKDAFNITAQSKILQFSSFSFDASVWEFVMALMNGASLSLVGHEIVSLGTSLSNVLQVLEITTVTLPPSVLSVIPFDPGSNNLNNLETIIVAGEQCPSQLAKKWRKDRKFVNAYGPTETTVCASMKIVDNDYLISPPIGTPIYNYKLYVLDQNLLPVSIGVPGELYISGPGLARGYLDKPGLTAEKFLPNPFSKVRGERMYKSGDLVKFLPHGELVFLGRIDNQVKLRGFRIELGEIESVLRKNSFVKDVIVDVKITGADEQKLVAYIVPEVENILIGDLKQFLRERLPEYMIPQHFILLNKLPLTPNDKIDRKALPNPDFSNIASNTEYVKPRNETEEKLANIISELLNIEKVGIYDNFFDLGGHSLLATQFVSKIKEDLGFDVPLRQLFENPTVENLILLIEKNELEIVGEDEKIEKQHRGSSSIEDLINELGAEDDTLQSNLDRK